jgi:hypothetical protein
MSPAELIQLEQGSKLWARARCGLVTASRCGEVVAMKVNKEEKAERAHYRQELIVEILTGEPYPHYVTLEMQWGRDQEPFARAAYELHRDVLVETCGLVLHPDIARFAASPDGLVDEDGLIQIKCPNTTTHLGWMLGGTIPLEHCPQMLAELSCTGRDWCDFVSFDCRLPPHLQLFVRRFYRDDELVAKLEAEVVHFNAQVQDVLRSLPEKPQGVVLCMDHVADDEVQF